MKRLDLIISGINNIDNQEFTRQQVLQESKFLKKSIDNLEYEIGTKQYELDKLLLDPKTKIEHCIVEKEFYEIKSLINKLNLYKEFLNKYYGS